MRNMKREKPDTQIRIEGMKALISALGNVDAERFVALINSEPFDYTEWRKEGLGFENMSARDLGKLAHEYASKIRE